MSELFFGTGIAHSILLFAFVIATGLFIGKYKIKGVSIGATWILFVGILLSHFGMRVNPTVLGFVKEFGLILFVFSIGLQVGPGFFHSFKKGGVTLNLLALILVFLAAAVAFAIHQITGESLATMVGVMSGAVTNTPGLGAAQQTMIDAGAASGLAREAASAEAAKLASGYAVAYPVGVIGVLFLVIIFKAVFKVDLEKEKAELEREEDNANVATSMYCTVLNPAVFHKSILEVDNSVKGHFVVSRLMRGGEVFSPGPDTVLEEGDKLLIVTDHESSEVVSMLFGKIADLKKEDFESVGSQMVARRLVITKNSLNGKKIRELSIRSNFGANITRVTRAGVDLVASPGLYLQVGDRILVVGEKDAVDKVSDFVGNRLTSLDHPNLIPIFFGIVLGIIFGSLPMKFPGIPQPIKLGLAGGPLIIAILLGYFGPKWRITTYTTSSVNMFMRELGISLFLAAVGLGAGETFVASLLGGGFLWILYGAAITIIPVLIIGLLGRLVFKLNFYQICGLIAGGTTNPPVLAFTQTAYGTDYSSINYATVYPLSMFLRVLVAQLMILISFM